MPRFFIPDVPLHVIQRGNNRSAMFADDSDRSFLCGYVQYAMRIHGVSIHAYVLMGNHFHLLVTPQRASSVPKMMQSVGRVYVRYFNDKYGRTGTLFEGRYKAAIVDDEHYLLTCMRYIELNPVRAGLVAEPAEYGWSSFRANAWGSPDALVSPHPLYAALGPTARTRRAVYRELFGTTPTTDELASIRDATQNAWALGSEAFRTRVGSLARRGERMPTGRPPRAMSHALEFDSDPI
jgi:putative transposase